jgi:prolyl-tRNA synthetase
VFFSKLYAPTLKESPSDADLIGIKYLIRAGFVRKIAAGIYTYLPLGWKVIKKIESIVREEMDAIGSQEIMLPIIQPAELWHESGRWEDYGPEMMKLKDRHDRDFTLGPTHEEMITAVVRNELKSYKQLPLSLYQIQNKYRDEIRPRFGLMRSREFIMKDAYTFHPDEKSLDEYYDLFYSAYDKIMKRLGLKYLAVEADSGTIGGKGSHEFNALAEAGESTILYCDCGYAATDEKAEYKIETIKGDEEFLPMEKVETPNVKTIEDVSKFLKVPREKIVKSLLYKGKKGFILVMIRGDQDLNEAKLKSYYGDQTIQMANPNEIMEEFNVPVGFIGPVGISKKVKIIGDKSVEGMKNYVVGGMENNYHYKNASPGKDFNIKLFADLKMVKKGDLCPVCGKLLKEKKGIELGQVFKLGIKYSNSMNGVFTDEDGKSKPYYMGCYGWGISRTLEASVEQLHDENGIIWPLSIAPYQIIITVVNFSDVAQKESGLKLYDMLKGNGYEVIIDDRKLSPGFKFKDADLIGFPLRITVGNKIKEGKIELKSRLDRDKKEIAIEDTDLLMKTVEEILKDYNPAEKSGE